MWPPSFLSVHMYWQLRQSAILLLAAIIWGSTFVAQALGMNDMGPMTFNFSRTVLGIMFLLIVLPWIDRCRRRNFEDGSDDGIDHSWSNPLLCKAALQCGLFLFLGMTLQQLGLLYTSVGKAGFITGIYIVLVPVVGFFIGRRCGFNVLLAVVLAVIGLYYLCMKPGEEGLNLGDILVFASAFAYTGHILTVDRFVSKVDGVRLSCAQFVVVMVLNAPWMVFYEHATFSQVANGIGPLLYAGILSSGIAYTLQIIGQRGLNPTVASLVMSLESVVSVLSGWLVMNQLLNEREAFGCFLMAIAIVIAQLPSHWIRINRRH